MSHTPALPLKISFRQESALEGGVGVLNDADDLYVGDVWCPDFIVKAVNNHDRLVEALKELCDALDKEYPNPFHASMLPQMEAARTILAEVDK